MLFIFVYSLRKRWSFLQRFGTQQQWLQTHIFLGLGGPLLIVIHSTGKFRGIAAIAFYSMAAIVASGFIGRYFYSKIPRTKKGREMSLKQIEHQLEDWINQLDAHKRKAAILARVEDYLSTVRKQPAGLLKTLFITILDDLKTPLHLLHVWGITGMEQELPVKRRLQMTRLIVKQRKLLKHLAVLDATQRLFTYWHVFHQPFVVITTVVVFVHVAVATYFGYGVGW